MNKKECPFCGELIQSGALKCRYCREWLNPEAELTHTTTLSADADTQVREVQPELEVALPEEENAEEPILVAEVELQTKEEEIIVSEEEEIISKEETIDQPFISIEKQAIEEEIIEEEIIADDDDVAGLAIVDELLGETIEALTAEGKVDKQEFEEMEEEILSTTNSSQESITLAEEHDASAMQFVSKDAEPEANEKEINEPSIVKESIITSPISYMPKNSNTYYQDKTEEDETEGEDHLIRWQNFKTNKILAIISFILTLLSSYYLYKEYTTDLTAVSAILLVLSFGLNTYLTYQMYEYVRNFDSYEEVKRPMQFLAATYALTTVGIVLFFVLYHFYMVIMLIIPIVCILLIVVLRLIVGWKLWKNTYDHVGGLESYGSIIFFSALLPGLGIVAPLVLFKVFADAQSHIEEYGYLDDNPNDY